MEYEGSEEVIGEGEMKLAKKKEKCMGNVKVAIRKRRVEYEGSENIRRKERKRKIKRFDMNNEHKERILDET